MGLGSWWWRVRRVVKREGRLGCADSECRKCVIVFATKIVFSTHPSPLGVRLVALFRSTPNPPPCCVLTLHLKAFLLIYRFRKHSHIPSRLKTACARRGVG